MIIHFSEKVNKELDSVEEVMRDDEEPEEVLAKLCDGSFENEDNDAVLVLEKAAKVRAKEITIVNPYDAELYYFKGKPESALKRIRKFVKSR